MICNRKKGQPLLSSCTRRRLQTRRTKPEGTYRSSRFAEAGGGFVPWGFFLILPARSPSRSGSDQSSRLVTLFLALRIGLTQGSWACETGQQGPAVLGEETAPSKGTSSTCRTKSCQSLVLCLLGKSRKKLLFSSRPVER